MYFCHSLNLTYQVIDKIKKSEFAKHVLTLVSGSSVAMLIPFAAEPVLSRMFTPAEFGIFEIYAALVVMIGSVATARYEMAIVLPGEEDKAVNLLGLSLAIVTAVSTVTYFIILFWGETLINLSHHKEFANYIFFVPIGVFLLGINRSLLYWSLRQKYMKIIGLTKVFESSGKAGSSILFGIMKMSSLGLILGQIAGQILSALLFIARFLKSDLKHIKSISKKHIKTQAVKYSEFPKINVLLTISEMMQISGLIFVFSLFFDSTTLGEVSKSIRILLIPLTVISTSVAQVFYQKASKEFAEGVDISINLNKIVRSMAIISFPGLILFLFISPWLFTFVLGNQWVVAGEYARILAIWIFIKFIMGPATTIPLIINKQKEYFILNLLGNFVLILSVIIPGALKLSVTEILITFGIIQVIFLIFLYFKILSMYHKSFNEL
jgi:O-antigen/teichoic acid export membrane protein